MSAPIWSKVLQFFPTLLKGNSGANPSVDWGAGSVQSITLNAATVTPTFLAPVGGANLALVITQDGTGGRAVTWPAAVKWIGGTAPILLSGANQTTLVYFYWDGTTYWGSLQTGASPASIIPWTAVAAGTALSASLARPNLAADSSGAQSTITLPTAAQLASSDGYEFTIKATGNMVSPVIVAAGAGTTIELLNAPGTFGASTWLPIQGQGVVFKYDLATTTFKVRASSEGSGAPGSSAYNPNWFAKTDVYWDPAAGVDSDTGAVGHPLQTMAEIVRRYGSIQPQLPFAQNLTVHQLTAQTLNVDVYRFAPTITGGGNFAIIGNMPNRGAAFSPTTVTAKVRTSAGNALRLNGNLPAGLAVGDVILNTNKNSYAKVQAIAGGNATMTQPLAAAGLTTVTGFPVFVADTTWAQADTYQAMIPVLSNAKSMQPVGGDSTNPAGAFGGAWYQGLYIPDASGTPGDSIVTAHPFGCSLSFTLCTFDAEMQLNDLDGFILAAGACSFNTFASISAGGATGSNGIIAGCALATFTLNGSNCFIDGDTIASTNVFVFGVGHALLGLQMLAGATIGIQPGSNAQIFQNSETGLGGGLIWGPGRMNVTSNGGFFNATGGTTWANCLKLAVLALDGAVTGWSPPAEGTFVLNGVTQVDVAGVNGVNAFPANATISLSLKTVGGTPGIVAPYFSAAQTQNAFHVKSGTALANDTFNWSALPASGVSLSSANLDIFQSLSNPRIGARFAFT